MPKPQPLYSAQQLGLLLRAARKGRKLTQADVGTRLNLSQARVSALENDPSALGCAQLLAWASVVGLKLSVEPASSETDSSSLPGSMTAEGKAVASARGTLDDSKPEW